MSASVSGKALAAVLGLTQGRVTQLRKQGVLSGTGSPPRYDLAASVQAYIAFVRESCRGGDQSDAEIKKAKADADYKEAKARQEEIKLAELEGRMHSAEDVERATNELVYTVRSMMLAMPGRIAVDVEGKTAAEAADIVRREVCDVLEHLAQFRYDPSVYAQMVRDRKGWRQEDGDEDD